MFIALASVSVLGEVFVAVTCFVLGCFFGKAFGASLSTLTLVVGCDCVGFGLPTGIIPSNSIVPSGIAYVRYAFNPFS